MRHESGPAPLQPARRLPVLCGRRETGHVVRRNPLLLRLGGNGKGGLRRLQGKFEANHRVGCRGQASPTRCVHCARPGNRCGELRRRGRGGGICQYLEHVHRRLGRHGPWLCQEGVPRRRFGHFLCARGKRYEDDARRLERGAGRLRRAPRLHARRGTHDAHESRRPRRHDLIQHLHQGGIATKQVRLCARAPRGHEGCRLQPNRRFLQRAPPIFVPRQPQASAL
mmetsp:Transcript_105630/g.297145  ORF Transcript_105630/g.297145 Transcript_105630/m.297145 type:complete len:225 (+) Transcript_105630:1093-1767(+)